LPRSSDRHLGVASFTWTSSNVVFAALAFAASRTIHATLPPFMATRSIIASAGSPALLAGDDPPAGM
jgi:hypothetical protein